MYCLEIRSFNNLLEFPLVLITPLVNKPILFLYEPEFIKILEREKKKITHCHIINMTTELAHVISLLLIVASYVTHQKRQFLKHIKQIIKPI